MSAAPWNDSDGQLRGLTPPLDGRAFRWSVGTRPVPASEWLCLADATPELMAEKHTLFDNQRSQVVVQLPGSGPAAAELLTCVTDFVATQNPTLAGATERIAAPDDDPGWAIEMCGRLVAEDFCILELDADNEWRLTAASVCFTSRWDLPSKLGQTVTEIHGPVPGYDSRLAEPVDQLFNRLPNDQVLVRKNWTLLDTGTRHLPEPTTPTEAPADLSDLHWLRIERQTLRRLPATNAIVFTILTQLRHVSELSADDQQALHQAIAAAPTDVRHYKSWPDETA